MVIGLLPDSVRDLSAYKARFRMLLVRWRPLCSSWHLFRSRNKHLFKYHSEIHLVTVSTSSKILYTKCLQFSFRVCNPRSSALTIKIFLWLQYWKTGHKVCVHVNCLIFLKVYFICYGYIYKYVIHIYMCKPHTYLYMYNNIFAWK